MKLLFEGCNVNALRASQLRRMHVSAVAARTGNKRLAVSRRRGDSAAKDFNKE
jgi:hypothetical protein